MLSSLNSDGRSERPPEHQALPHITPSFSSSSLSSFLFPLLREVDMVFWARRENPGRHHGACTRTVGGPPFTLAFTRMSNLKYPEESEETHKNIKRASNSTRTGEFEPGTFLLPPQLRAHINTTNSTCVW